MSEVLDRTVVRSAPRTLVDAPVVTDLDRERVEAFIAATVARPLGEPEGTSGEAMNAATQVWRPAGSRGLRVVEGLAVAAVMGYFLMGLFSVITGV